MSTRKLIGCCNPHYEFTAEQQARFKALLTEFRADTWIRLESGDDAEIEGWSETNQWQMLYYQPLVQLASEVIPDDEDEPILAAHELVHEWANEIFWPEKHPVKATRKERKMNKCFIYEAGLNELLTWSEDKRWSENYAGLYVTVGFSTSTAADVLSLMMRHGDYLKDNVYGPFGTIEAANAAIKEMESLSD